MSHLRRDNILRKCQALDSPMYTDLRGMSHRSHAYHYNGTSLWYGDFGLYLSISDGLEVPAGFGRFRLVDVIFRMNSKISDPFK